MKTMTAKYENGLFRPCEPVNLETGATVQILLPDAGDDNARLLQLRYPNSYGVLDAADADEMMAIVDEQRRQSILPKATE